MYRYKIQSGIAFIDVPYKDKFKTLIVNEDALPLIEGWKLYFNSGYIYASKDNYILSIQRLLKQEELKQRLKTLLEKYVQSMVIAMLVVI